MTALAQDFTVWQGEYKPIDVTVYEPDGIARKNITGATITWIIKKRVNTEVLVTKSTDSGIIITSATEGEFSITLNPVDTNLSAGKYYHEARSVINDEPETILVGELTIKESGFRT